MQMDAEKTEFTKVDESLRFLERNENKLTTRQQQAVELLALGESKTKVASEIGVSRQQIHKWSQNVYFRAKFLKRHTELWQENKESLRGLTGKAVAVIESELENGNIRAAVELLKIVGLSGGKIALLVQPAKSVDDLLELEAAKLTDAYMSNMTRPSTTQEIFTREFVERPALIRSNMLRLKAMTKPPDDNDEEVL